MTVPAAALKPTPQSPGGDSSPDRGAKGLRGLQPARAEQQPAGRLLLSPQGNLHMSVSGCSCIVKENLPPQGKAFGERWGHGGRKSLFGFEKGFLPPYAELLLFAAFSALPIGIFP